MMQPMKILAALYLFLFLASAAPPSITKVEPPDWPAEAQTTTLRLLLTGTNLTGARVEAPFPTSGIAVSASGTHLFLDLKLPAHTSPGNYSIRVGGAVARFAVVAPLPRSGRFQGFSPDDVV
jgi:hypothetical protein